MLSNFAQYWLHAPNIAALTGLLVLLWTDLQATAV